MTKVKIIGAGSIGNHLSNASRAKGWDVTLCDVDPAALERTRNDIYPSRYGAFDEAITLALVDDAPKGGFDWIFIGTPPDSHMPLALAAVEEQPKAILIEKPFATPGLTGCQELFEKAEAADIKCFVGYDHVVAKSTQRFSNLAQSMDDVQTLDVFFREHWQGIFNAHHWLSGPSDSYLGFWERGGGACGEHSHAINLWQHFAHQIGAGRVVEVSATLDYVKQGGADYDQLALMNLRTESGLTGSVVQDVVTNPPLKCARVQARDAAIEWQCRVSPYSDVVRRIGQDGDEEVFDKTRPDDFIQELDHLEQALAGSDASPISITRGLDTMLVIAAVHLSAQKGRVVKIDYDKGYVSGALAV